MKQTKVFYILHKNRDSNDLDVSSINLYDEMDTARTLANWQKEHNAQILLWRGWYKEHKSQIQFDFYFNHYRKMLVNIMLAEVKSYRVGNTVKLWNHKKRTYTKVDVSIFSIFSKFVC